MTETAEAILKRIALADAIRDLIAEVRELTAVVMKIEKRVAALEERMLDTTAPPE